MKIFYIVLLSIIIAAAKNSPLSVPQQKDFYFVTAPHTPDQCRKAMEGVKEQDQIQLSKFYYGCHFNDHTLYGVVETTSADEARNSLPLALRPNAKIQKVEKLSTGEIKKMHKEEND